VGVQSKQRRLFNSFLKKNKQRPQSRLATGGPIERGAMKFDLVLFTAVFFSRETAKSPGR
jgi:hypothetical protein